MKKIVDFLFTGKTAQWTALSTVAMAIFSALLWHVSDTANETNIATQQATLSFTGPAFAKIVGPDGKKWIGVNIFEGIGNSGSVPAIHGEVQYNFAAGEDIPETGAGFSVLPQSKTMNIVVSPHNGFQIAPVTVPTQTLEAIGKSSQHYFLWGWVVYDDGFPNTPKRLTEFCTEITTINWTKPDHSDPTGDLQTFNPPCKVHNCYDKQCDDYNARTQ